MSLMSSFKGFVGESVINIATWLKLDKHTYHRLNNITLPLANGGSTQVDHVIVSVYGIFVIETKNYKGWIFGNEKQKQWTQVFPNGSKYKFQNPLRQNYLHIKTLSELLGLDQRYFHSMIAFIGECELKTRDELPEHVLKGGVISYIKKKQDNLLSEMEVKSIVQQIESNRFDKSWRTNRAHKAYLKDKHADAGTQPNTSLRHGVNNGLSDSDSIQNNDTEPKVKSKGVVKEYDRWSGQVEQADSPFISSYRTPPHSNNNTFITPFPIVDGIPEVNDSIGIKNNNIENNVPVNSEQISELVSLAGSMTNPTCPKCHGEMVERIAKKGARQGQTFYGCKQFPKCWGIVNIN